MDSRFEGNGLTEYVYAHFFIQRFSGENDWDFRKRVFVNIFPHASLPAIEILLGCSFDAMTPQDKATLDGLTMSCHSCVLSRFVRNIPEDPMKKRKQEQIAHPPA